MEIRELLYIILGWLLGIVGPWIIDFIKNHYKRRWLKNSLKNELQDIQKRLTWIPYLILRDYWELDLKTIHWFRSQNFFNQEISDDIKNLFYKTDEEIQKDLGELNVTSNKETPNFNFRKIETYIIDSNLLNLYLLDNSIQTNILDCKFHLNTLNKEIDLINDFFKMTFDSNMSSENHKIIEDNIYKKNHLIIDLAIWCVETTDKLIKKLN